MFETDNTSIINEFVKIRQLLPIMVSGRDRMNQRSVGVMVRDIIPLLIREEILREMAVSIKIFIFSYFLMKYYF